MIPPPRVDAGYRLVRAIGTQRSVNTEGGQSAAPTAGGEVTIAGLVDGGIRQVFVSLAGDDYQRAVQAHHQELEVSVEGELVREGRSYRLGNPRMFAIVE